MASYVLTLQSNYCKHFGAHPARLFSKSTFIFTYMVAFFFFFFFKNVDHSRHLSLELVGFFFFRDIICHKLLIYSCLSGGTWMESPGLFNVLLSGVRTFELLCGVRC